METSRPAGGGSGASSMQREGEGTATASKFKSANVLDNAVKEADGDDTAEADGVEADEEPFFER